MGITIIFLLILLLVLGVLLAVVVSITCGTIAKFKNGDTASLVVAGALYGFFVFPWPLLLARMFGRSLPVPLISVIYFFPYAIWLGLVCGMLGQIVAIWHYTTGIGRLAPLPGANYVSAILMSILFGAFAYVIAHALIRSLRSLRQQYREDRLRPPGDDVPDSAYVMPFVYVYAWSLFGIFAAIIAVWYAASIGMEGMIGF